MKFAAHVTLAGQPEFRLKAQMAPLAFEMDGEGAVEIGTGKIEAEIGAIPLMMRIPFLPPSQQVAAGSLGPFRICIRPASATIRALGLGIEGKVGTAESTCAVEGKAGGELEVDLKGEIPGRLIKAAMEEALEE